MSDTDKITAIIQAIQIDANLMILLKISVAKNIGNVSSDQLTAICAALGIQTQ